MVYLGIDLRRQKKALGKVRQRREKKLVRNMSMSKLPCGQLELNPAGYSLINPMGLRIIPLEDNQSAMFIH